LSKAKTKKAKANLKRDLYRAKVKLASSAGIQRNAKVDETQGNKLYHKIHYVRYADDYLIAIKGPKSLALIIKKATENFLKSSLHFALKGGELVHASHSKVRFLGFDIKLPGRSDREVVENRRVLSFKKLKNRILNRKKMLENRISTALTAEYDLKVKKEILALANKNLNKTSRSNDITNLAHLEANTVHFQALSKQKLWSPEQGPFKI